MLFRTWLKEKDMSSLASGLKKANIDAKLLVSDRVVGCNSDSTFEPSQALAPTLTLTLSGNRFSRCCVQWL